jgi:hypothetical protein
MATWMVVVLVSVAVAVVSGLIWAAVSNERRNRAGRDASPRAGRVETHPLSNGEQDHFAERWRSTQASFVDSPAGAASAAETLVEEVMRARGYPVGDFDLRAADMSLDHPQFVKKYREARALYLASQRGASSKEELARAAVRYRALFEDLLNRDVN